MMPLITKFGASHPGSGNLYPETISIIFVLTCDQSNCPRFILFLWDWYFVVFWYFLCFDIFYVLIFFMFFIFLVVRNCLCAVSVERVERGKIHIQITSWAEHCKYLYISIGCMMSVSVWVSVKCMEKGKIHIFRLLNEVDLQQILNL